MTMNLVTVLYPICFDGRHCHFMARVYQAVCEDYTRVLGIELDPAIDAGLSDYDRNKIFNVIRWHGLRKLDHGQLIC